MTSANFVSIPPEQQQQHQHFTFEIMITVTFKPNSDQILFQFAAKKSNRIKLTP